MIPFDVKYHRAETVNEAVAAWNDGVAAGEDVLYYGGGTEIVTLARDNKLRADRFIDYKRIPEARRMPGAEGAADDPSGRIVWGSAVRLNEVVDGGSFGLLARCCVGIADRTVRNSITLGGNVCGMLPYREAVLPFLLLDGDVETAEPETAEPETAEPGTAGPGPAVKSAPVASRFNKKLRLEKGELVLGFSLDHGLAAGLESDGVTVADRGWGPLEAWASGSRGGWFYTRRTREPRLDYPLVTLILARVDGRYRLALTGAFGYPLRAEKAEAILNRAAESGDLDGDFGGVGWSDRLNRLAAEALDAEGVKYKDDIRGNREYRRNVTVQSLAAGLVRLAGGER
jgi:xanthine dehydrogenase FAD-binding subunit